MSRAMVMAAGRGERMGRHTAAVPKPLLRVGGEPLITRHLRALARAGIGDIVVNIAYRGEMLREALGDGSQWGIKIHYSDEGEHALETAGGIIKALPLLGDDPFLVVSADVVHDLDLTTLALSDGALGQLVLVTNPPHHRQGDFGLAVDGKLTVSPPRLTFSGVALLDPRLFDGLACGPRPLRDVFMPAAGRGELTGYHHGGIWIDVGTPERLKMAQELVARHD